MSPEFIIRSSYALVSLFVYFIVCTIMLRYKRTDFDSSYYTLFLISSLVNLLTFLNTILTMRIPIETCSTCLFAPLFKLKRFFGIDFMAAGLQYFGYLQYFMNTMIAVNRLLCVVRPFTHEKVWKKVFPVFLILIIILPIPLCYPRFIYPSSYFYLGWMKADAYALESFEPPESKLAFMSYFAIVCTLMNAAINGTTLVILFKKKHHYKSAEIKLLVHNLIQFLTELSASLDIFVMYAWSGDVVLQLWCMYLLPFFSDALTFISPYSLILCSTPLRDRLFPCFRRKQKHSTPSTQISIRVVRVE